MPPVFSSPAPPVPFVAAPRPVYRLREVAASLQICEPGSGARHVPEAFVHDLWHYQQFRTDALQTIQGEQVVVYNPGRPNDDAGPDFRDARVRIGDMEWRGDVEIHVASRSWFDHGHHEDPRYDSVVLHVTLHADVWTGGLTRADDTVLPELVLASRLETPLRDLLHRFRTRPDDDLVCASRWADVPEDVRRPWIARLSDERMEAKRDRLATDRDRSLPDALRERLYAGLGYAANATPLSMLADRLPASTLSTLDHPRDVEALHFGAAGLIPEPKDLLEADRPTADYAMDLRTRFRRLQTHLSLAPMDAAAWTFFRLRPNNFPTRRIAQAAAWYRPEGLLHGDPLPRLRTALREERPPRSLRRLLAAEPSAFWETHYHLTASTSPGPAALGQSRIDTLIVNAVLPVLLLDADRRGDADQRERCVRLLDDLPAPRDRILRRFRRLGTRARSAADAQGLHRLYRSYCQTGGCLRCAIGQWLVDGTG